MAAEGQWTPSQLRGYRLPSEGRENRGSPAVLFACDLLTEICTLLEWRLWERRRKDCHRRGGKLGNFRIKV